MQYGLRTRTSTEQFLVMRMAKEYWRTGVSVIPFYMACLACSVLWYPSISPKSSIKICYHIALCASGEQYSMWEVIQAWREHSWCGEKTAATRVQVATGKQNAVWTDHKSSRCTKLSRYLSQFVRFFYHLRDCVSGSLLDIRGKGDETPIQWEELVISRQPTLRL